MNDNSVIGRLVSSFSLATRFSYDHFLSLLYYLGLLTIVKDAGNLEFEFRAPNQIIRDIYYDYYYTYLIDYSDITDILVQDSLAALTHGDALPLVELIEKIISESTAKNNRYMIHFRENSLQTLFFVFLRKSLDFNVYMEYKTEAGYIDIFCKPIQGKDPVIFKFKYISTAKYEENAIVLKLAQDEVTAQIESDIDQIGSCTAYSIIFVGKQCMYNEKRTEI